MKKYLFPLMVGMMALSGCTSEEVIDVSQQKAITFENVINKNSRAVDGDLTLTDFSNFLVYGYYMKSGSTTPIQIFNGVEVHKIFENNSYKWVYTGQRYWVPGCTYYFYAYSCADIALSQGKGNPNMTLLNATTVDTRALAIYDYLCDGIHQHDLVFAEHESILATEKDNPEVSLKFSHGLCKIEAEFTTDFPEGYEIKISSVSISDFYNYADFNVGTGVWSDFEGKNVSPINLEVQGTGIIKIGDANSPKAINTTQAFLIPKFYDTKTENVKLHFTVTVSKNGEVILERHINGTWAPQWDKGHVYKYNINITGSTAGIEPIVFSAQQSLDENGNGWDNQTEVPMIFGVDAAN